MAFDFSYPNKDAEARGWGKGWQPGMPIGTRPTGQPGYPGRIVPLSVKQGDKTVTFDGGVREEIQELLELVLTECVRRGYRFTDPGCWGGAFRPTKRSDGTYTTTPSNHSWYLAVDISAPKNVYGGTSTDIPQWMQKLLQDHGFRWLGPPIKDWMHFDFCGTPRDAVAMTKKARLNFKEDEDEVAYSDFKKGVNLFRKGEPLPDNSPPDTVFGYRFAKWTQDGHQYELVEKE